MRGLLLLTPNSGRRCLDYIVRAPAEYGPGAVGTEVRSMAKNTGKKHRVGAVKSRSEFKRGSNWFKRDTKTGRILNGSPEQHKGVRNEK